MATIDRKGILHGSVSNLVYRSYRGQQITQIKPSRIKQTLKSKEAGFEFGLASTTACAIRQAFAKVFPGNDGAMNNRLIVAVRKCIDSSDKERGERDIHDGDPSVLRGFQFNANSPLDAVLAVRPSAELTPENQLRISLPAITKQDIKGPYCNEYLIRLVAISFDFRKAVYSYSGYHEIKIDHLNPYAGGEIIMDGVSTPGRMLLLSMSVHGYNADGFGGMQSINSQDWSPAEIIGGWQISDSEQEPEVVVQSFPMTYSGNELLSKIMKIRATQKKLKVTLRQVPPKGDSMEFKLPKGDIPMG